MGEPELDLYDDKVQEAIQWTMVQWGTALGLKTWTQGDGSESVEGDVHAEINNILVDAGLRCEMTGEMATLATPAQPDTGDVAALRAEAELEADMERDLTESDQEAIERGLRTILAFDAVGNLRSVLSDTMARQHNGYDWNADPDGMTLRQSTAIQQADRILAALSKPNAQGREG